MEVLLCQKKQRNDSSRLWFIAQSPVISSEGHENLITQNSSCYSYAKKKKTLPLAGCTDGNYKKIEEFILRILFFFLLLLS